MRNIWNLQKAIMKLKSDVGITVRFPIVEWGERMRWRLKHIAPRGIFQPTDGVKRKVEFAVLPDKRLTGVIKIRTTKGAQ